MAEHPSSETCGAETHLVEYCDVPSSGNLSGFQKRRIHKTGPEDRFPKTVTAQPGPPLLFRPVVAILALVMVILGIGWHFQGKLLLWATPVLGVQNYLELTCLACAR